MAAKRKVIPVVEEATSLCKDCRHVWLYEDTWLCRRYPPIVIYDYEEGMPATTFPVVAPDLTCGEHSPAHLNS